MSTKGQALIEALVCTGFLSVIFYFSILIFLKFMSKITIDEFVEQFFLCRYSQNEISICTENLKKQLLLIGFNPVEINSNAEFPYELNLRAQNRLGHNFDLYYKTQTSI